MPLEIGRVDAQVEITPPAEAGSQPQGRLSAAASMDIERLRPMVLQILQEELADFRRQQG